MLKTTGMKRRNRAEQVWSVVTGVLFHFGSCILKGALVENAHGTDSCICGTHLTYKT